MVKSKVTMIKLREVTKKRLGNLKLNKRESFDDVLNRLMKVISICRTCKVSVSLPEKKEDTNDK